MENYICKSKTLITKKMHREYYWGAWRWHGKAKTKFMIRTITDIFELVILFVGANLLIPNPSGKEATVFIILRVLFWVSLALAIVRTVFQGEFFVIRLQRSRKKLRGDDPVFTEMEFYEDHFRYWSELYNRTEQLPYANIIKYKETSNYCVLFLVNDSQYVYGKEEFLQGSAAEAYALFSKYIRQGK